MARAPEKHIESETFAEDIAHLRMKQDSGADFLMTQLCFDTEHFKDGWTIYGKRASGFRSMSDHAGPQ